MKIKVLLTALAALNLVACDGVLVETKQESQSDIFAKRLKDDGLRNCLNDVVASKGWLKIEEVKELSCSTNYPVSSLENLKYLTSLEKVTIENLDVFTDADVSELKNLTKLKELTLDDDGQNLFYGCGLDADLKTKLGDGYSPAKCSEILNIIGTPSSPSLAIVTDPELNSCLQQTIAAGDYVLELADVTTLACPYVKPQADVNAKITSLAGLDKFGKLTDLTLTNYSPTNFTSDLDNTFKKLSSLEKLDLGSLELTALQVSALQGALPSVPQDQLPTINDRSAIEQLADAGLKKCVSATTWPGNLLVNFKELTCDEEVETAKGLEIFTALTKVTLSKYHRFFSSDPSKLEEGDIGSFKKLKAAQPSLVPVFADDFACRKDQESVIDNQFTWMNGSNLAAPCIDTTTTLDPKLANVAAAELKSCLTDESIRIGATSPLDIKRFVCPLVLGDDLPKFSGTKRELVLGINSSDPEFTPYSIGDLSAFKNLEEVDLTYRHLKGVTGLYGTDANEPTKLKILKLAYSTIDKNGDSKAISSLQNLLENSVNLEELDLSFTRLKPNNDSATHTALRTNVQQLLAGLTKMKMLDLRGFATRDLYAGIGPDKVGDGLASDLTYIKHMPNLTSFKIGHTSVGQKGSSGSTTNLDGLKNLSDNSVRTTKFEHINLMQSNLTDDDADDLAALKDLVVSNATIALNNLGSKIGQTGNKGQFDGALNSFSADGACPKLLELAKSVTGIDYQGTHKETNAEGKEEDKPNFNTGSVTLPNSCNIN